MVGLPVCNFLKFQKNQTEFNKSGEQIIFFENVQRTYTRIFKASKKW